MYLSFSPELVVFLLGTFAAAFVTGLAGFAFGMVAASIWPFALPPAQTTTLIVAYALLVQGYATWRLRAAIDYKRLLPFVFGSAIGIPIGVFILEYVRPAYIRTGVGVLLIAFSLYNLTRPRFREMKGLGRGGDVGVGILNGVLGASTGLGGILPVIWTTLCGWTRDEQRGVHQPTAFATFVMSLVGLGGAGLMTPATIHLLLLGLPLLIAGTLLGWALYGKLDEATFRKVVLVLLLLSGMAIVVTVRGPVPQ
ncbi:MAG TPA: sulfite exporter TauE/SafE family protein [Steroidobacteraceae bacterium]|jgi:uncharacterized membrane protein YfcA|nr:sulfite exporter TauE/SafE family protein [Steroidobacteraceae bacterium]